MMVWMVVDNSMFIIAKTSYARLIGKEHEFLRRPHSEGVDVDDYLAHCKMDKVLYHLLSNATFEFPTDRHLQARARVVVCLHLETS